MDTVLISKSLLGDAASSVVSADGEEIGLCKFRTSNMTSFRGHISKIVTLGAKKEMIRTAAKRLIAVMTDVQSIRNRTMHQSPGNTMREIVARTHPGISVAATGYAARPQPAAIGLLDLRPKAFG